VENVKHITHLTGGKFDCLSLSYILMFNNKDNKYDIAVYVFIDSLRQIQLGGQRGNNVI
jgi:hypothetical protein